MKADGSPCQANARPSGYCTFHDPELATKREEARRAGGRKRSRGAAVLADAPDVPVGSAADVTALLGQSINEVRQGKIAPRVANAVGYLASVVLRAMEVGTLAERVAALEAKLSGEGKP